MNMLRRFHGLVALTVAACAGQGDGADVTSTAASQLCGGAAGLSSNVSSYYAQPGTPVQWTASASCGLGDVPEYQFWMLPPGGTWTIAQPYGASNTYNWTTTGAATGNYEFQVWIRATGSAAAYD